MSQPVGRGGNPFAALANKLGKEEVEDNITTPSQTIININNPQTEAKTKINKAKALKSKSDPVESKSQKIGGTLTRTLSKIGLSSLGLGSSESKISHSPGDVPGTPSVGKKLKKSQLKAKSDGVFKSTDRNENIEQVTQSWWDFVVQFLCSNPEALIGTAGNLEKTGREWEPTQEFLSAENFKYAMGDTYEVWFKKVSWEDVANSILAFNLKWVEKTIEDPKVYEQMESEFEQLYKKIDLIGSGLVLKLLHLENLIYKSMIENEVFEDKTELEALKKSIHVKVNLFFFSRFILANAQFKLQELGRAHELNINMDEYKAILSFVNSNRVNLFKRKNYFSSNVAPTPEITRKRAESFLNKPPLTPKTARRKTSSSFSISKGMSSIRSKFGFEKLSSQDEEQKQSSFNLSDQISMIAHEVVKTEGAALINKDLLVYYTSYFVEGEIKDSLDAISAKSFKMAKEIFDDNYSELFNSRELVDLNEKKLSKLQIGNAAQEIINSKITSLKINTDKLYDLQITVGKKLIAAFQAQLNEYIKDKEELRKKIKMKLFELKLNLESKEASSSEQTSFVQAFFLSNILVPHIKKYYLEFKSFDSYIPSKSQIDQSYKFMDKTHIEMMFECIKLVLSEKKFIPVLNIAI